MQLRDRPRALGANLFAVPTGKISNEKSIFKQRNRGRSPPCTSLLSSFSVNVRTTSRHISLVLASAHQHQADGVSLQHLLPPIVSNLVIVPGPPQLIQPLHRPPILFLLFKSLGVQTARLPQALHRRLLQSPYPTLDLLATTTRATVPARQSCPCCCLVLCFIVAAPSSREEWAPWLRALA